MQLMCLTNEHITEHFQRDHPLITIQLNNNEERGFFYKLSKNIGMTFLTAILTILQTCRIVNRSIAIAVPPLCNKLPPVQRQISDPSYELTKTSPLAISPQVFYSTLKTLLFHKAYPDPIHSLPLTSLAISTTRITHLSLLTVCLPHSLDLYHVHAYRFCFV